MACPSDVFWADGLTLITVCVVRQPYAAGSAAPPYNFDVAVLSCTTADGIAYELLEGDFFDDQDLLIVVRTPGAFAF